MINKNSTVLSTSIFKGKKKNTTLLKRTRRKDLVKDFFHKFHHLHRNINQGN